MGAIETKTFRSGNSVAVRLPKSLGVGPDERMLIERQNGVLTLRPAEGREAERSKVARLRAALEAIGRPSDGTQRRPDFIAPVRRGL